jgi:hypothetical protein
MLFKRALLESGAPLVIFIDEDKIPSEAVPGQCFLVCDEKFPWQFACRNSPIALVCAFRSEERAQTTLTRLEDLGLWRLEQGRKGEAPWPVIISNDVFWNRRQEWLNEALGQAENEADLEESR